MIPEQAIVEWRREAPWDANSLVEQDLVVSRAVVEMYSVPEIALATRVPRRDGSLQAPPSTGCALLRRHRPRSDPTRGHRRDA